MNAQHHCLAEIAQMLVLSTAHMHPVTAAGWMDECPWACFGKAGYGWFMHVPEDPGVTDAADIPLEIRSALHVARKRACQWIMWDAAGPVLDELPHYDW